MKTIYEDEILNKGLDWVKSFDEFNVKGSHYIPYPDILRQVKHLYEIKIEYFGPDDQGSTICAFIKVNDELREIIKIYNKAFLQFGEAINKMNIYVSCEIYNSLKQKKYKGLNIFTYSYFPKDTIMIGIIK